MGAMASTTSGHRMMLPISPVWPPPFVALGDDDVDARFLVLQRLVGAPAQGRHFPSGAVNRLDYVRGVEYPGHWR